MKKKTRSQLVKKLDSVFSEYIRRKDSKNDMNECFTCGKVAHWKELQCGHFQSRKHYSTRWDENNCKPQCSGCNIFRAGEQFKFGQKLGEMAHLLVVKARETVKFSNSDLEEMIVKYDIKGYNQ